MAEMIVYYMEKKADGTVSLFNGKMSERHQLWAARPNAKEISKKEYDALLDTLSNPETNPKLLKFNK